MSNRTIRRAIERKARKLERKNTLNAAAVVPSTPTAATPQDSTIATDTESIEVLRARVNAQYLERRALINRANAMMSTGPSTTAGKAASARNSLKHGLTGNTVLLDADDAVEYQSRLDYYTDLYKPANFEERRLVQAIHDAAWRLDRIANLESTVYARGRLELEGACADVPEAQRKSFILLEISQKYDKDLRNLHLQETRIQRQRAKDLAALQQLQSERRASEEKAAEAAATVAKVTPAQPQPQTDGFVFSTPEIALEIADSTPIEHLKSRQEAA